MMGHAPGQSFDTVVALIRGADRFLICSHRSPEGDCIGASLALYHGLRQLGKEACLFNQDPIPHQLRFLEGVAQVQNQLPSGAFGAIFVVDCGSLQRVGPLGLELPARGCLVNIDHHKTNDAFGTINLVDPEASCAGEIVYRLLQALGIRVGRPIAEAIYAAILTDTGSFHYANARVEAFEIARELVAGGLEPARVAEGLFESMPVARLELLSRVLGTLELASDGRWALVRLTRGMLEQTGARPSDAENFINFPRSIQGVEVAMLFREGEDGPGVSFRSKGRVDVSAIAAHFQGGGHRNASACLLDAPLHEAVPRVIQVVEAALEAASS